MLQPGDVLLDKYLIERIVGEGGMGVVVLAHHLQLDQPVAIKYLRPEVLDEQGVVKRFLREARATVKLRSEHVCKVHDVGTLDNGLPYIVMEFMEGVELGALAREHDRLEPGEVVELLLQACEALAEAHALGIVHRDIKPSNLFVTRRLDGSALLKVLDFGISKMSACVDPDLTGIQTVIGTPAYMSPEQMRASKHVDARADIWALGVVLYELLTGRRPFKGSAFSELCLQVGMDPTPAMDATVPAGLEAAVARCLEKEPARRFQNVAELAAALAPHAHDLQRANVAVERIARLLGVAIPAVKTASMTGEQTLNLRRGPPSTLSVGMGQVVIEQAPPRQRWLVAGAALAILAAATVVVVMLVGGFVPGVSGNDSGASRPAVPAQPDRSDETEHDREPGVTPSDNRSGDRSDVMMDAGVDALSVDERAQAADEAGEDTWEQTTAGEAGGASSQKGAKPSSRKTGDHKRKPARGSRTNKASVHDDLFDSRK